MKHTFLPILVALFATTALWAQNNVITYTASAKLTETTSLSSSGLHTNAFNVEKTDHTFAYGIGTITFDGDVTTIGSYAFYDCSGLTSVTIPASVTSIGSDAFSYCSGLTSVTIPASVTTIGGWAFYACSGLTSITIPNSVTSIGSDAFYECSGLTSITIPASVTTIGESAFVACSGVTSFLVDAANTHFSSVEGVLFNYDKTTLIQYPIGNPKTTYTIPSSVTTIGEDAFHKCSGLTSITIPSSVTTIEKCVFGKCTNLTSIRVEKDNPNYDVTPKS